jgi:hypothetical protein
MPEDRKWAHRLALASLPGSGEKRKDNEWIYHESHLSMLILGCIKRANLTAVLIRMQLEWMYHMRSKFK